MDLSGMFCAVFHWIFFMRHIEARGRIARVVVLWLETQAPFVLQLIEVTCILIRNDTPCVQRLSLMYGTLRTICVMASHCWAKIK